MSLILPDHYPYFNDLSGVQTSTGNDLSAMRIGFLNLMPEAEKYEPSVLVRLGKHPRKIRPVFIRSEMHSYTSSDKEHLSTFYLSFAEAIVDGLDGLIITGAPVEKIPYEQVRYWPEICDILSYSRKNIAGTLGLCWGGLALAGFLGIGKTVFSEKIFGVFPSVNLKPEQLDTGSAEPVFYCPQSRYAGFDEVQILEKSSAGEIDLLAHSPETGHFIFSSRQDRFTGHIGHPEYTVERILFEYHRDQKAGLGNIPRYFNPEMPEYNWEVSGTSFFTGWTDRLLR